MPGCTISVLPAEKPKGKGLRLSSRNSLPCLECRREDSNLHSLNGNQVLNLSSVQCVGVGATRGLHWKFGLYGKMRRFAPCTCIVGTVGLHGQSCPPFAPQ